MAPKTTRRVLLGDWKGPVRDPLGVLRLVFLAGIVLFAILGDVKGIGNLAVASIAVLLARAAQLPRIYDLAVIVAMAFTGWGEALGLYDALPWYDNVVHFVVPLLTSQVIYLCLARLEVLPDLREETLPRHHLGIFVVTFALGVAVGGLWEIFEYGSDHIFGSELPARQRRHRRRPHRRQPRRPVRRRAAGGVDALRVGLGQAGAGHEPGRDHVGLVACAPHKIRGAGGIGRPAEIAPRPGADPSNLWGNARGGSDDSTTRWCAHTRRVRRAARTRRAALR